jgi:hypothetical protein
MEEGASMQMPDFNKNECDVSRGGVGGGGNGGGERKRKCNPRLCAFLRASAPPREPIANLSLRRVANDIARNHQESPTSGLPT